MGYLTNADIENRLGTALHIELTDDTGSGSADPAKVDEARQAAEGEINSYLATRYQTPVDLAGEPEMAAVLKGVALNLAIYRLHGRKPPVPADVLRGRGESVLWLERVAASEVQLPSLAAVKESDVSGIVAEKAGPSRTMTREGLADL